MKKYYVYEHWRLDKDECFYVGKGSGNRAYDLTSNRNQHFKNVIKYLRSLGMVAEIKIVASGLDEVLALDIEISQIKKRRLQGHRLVNQTDGGDGVSGLLEETRKIIGYKSKEYWQNLSDEEKALKKKITSAGVKEWWKNLSKEKRANLSNIYRECQIGRKHSNEARKKVSIARLGKKFTLEHKQKLSQCKLGVPRKPFTEETKTKMREAAARRELLKREMYGKPTRWSRIKGATIPCE